MIGQQRGDGEREDGGKRIAGALAPPGIGNASKGGQQRKSPNLYRLLD